MSRTILSIAVLVVLSPSGTAQTCSPAWAEGTFTSAGFSAAISAFVQYDSDGPGPTAPVMVVGGSFGYAGGVPSPYIAQGDGATWSPLDAVTLNVCCPDRSPE